MTDQDILRTRNLFPTKRGPPQRVPLSIIDSSAPFAPTSVIWVMDDVDVPKLESSLQAVVDALPVYSGRMRFVEPVVGGSVYERLGHVIMTYFQDDDPGVELQVEQSGLTLADVMGQLDSGDPSVLHGLSSRNFVDVMPFPPVFEAPTMRVKINVLQEPSGRTIVLGMTLPHQVGDARTCQIIMNCWADAYNDRPTSPAPVFDPRAIDKLAVPFDKPDPKAIEKALQVHAVYDYWATEQFRYLPGLKKFYEPRPDLIAMDPLGSPLPPHQRTSKRNELKIFKFPAQLVKDIHTNASSKAARSVRLSHLDSLVMHIFERIVKARKIPDDETVICFTPVELRPQFRDTHPDILHYIGNTAVATNVSGTAGSVNVAEWAQRLRARNRSFTKETAAAVYHYHAQRSSPTRFCNFFHSHHTALITSSCTLNVFNLPIGKTLHHQMNLRPSDGLVQIIENGPNERWYDNEVWVYVWLAKDAMRRLVADPKFRNVKEKL